jgi:hypothetical protein
MDLKIIDNGNGGDAVFNGSDLEIISGWENMPYLGLTGGNIEANTIKFNDGEQRYDYWANSLFYPNNKNIQFNSDFERLLNNVSITSASRVLIEQTIKSDLSFMSSFSSVSVSVSVVGLDRIEILIKVKEPDNLESNEFIYIWDATKKELSSL